MMKNRFTLIAIVFLMTQHAFAQSVTDQIQAVYNSYCNAVRKGNEKALKNALSTEAYERAKALSLANNMKFPDDFFKVTKSSLIDLKKLTYRRTNHATRMANLIYSGPDEDGRASIFIFKFKQENEKWKYEFGEIRSTSEIRSKIAAGDFSFLNSTEFGLQNSGKP